MAHILVIDDEEFIRDAVEIMLGHDGHTADLAENGVIATDMFFKKHYDLVILDVFMPVKGGLETMLDIKRINKSSKVLIMSGGSENIEKTLYLNKIKNLGADAIIAKPFSHSELSEIINQLIA